MGEFGDISLGGALLGRFQGQYQLPAWLEAGQKVDIGYFGAHGHLPLGVALLLAAVLGVLLVVIPGTGRIIQLRIVARRHRRIDAARAARQASATQQAPAQPASAWPPGAPEQGRP